MAMSALLSRSGGGDLLTPWGEESEPIRIDVNAAEGEVVIVVENSFLLRRNTIEMGLDNGATEEGKTSPREGIMEKVAKAKEQLDKLGEQIVGDFKKITVRKDGWRGPGWAVEGKTANPTGEGEVRASCLQSWARCLAHAGGKQPSSTPPLLASRSGGIALRGQMEVYLRLLDGLSKRRLQITCPLVEDCPPQCTLLGSGSKEVNGTYDLAGFQNAAPVYTKGNNVTIAKECLGGRDGWIIGLPPGRIFYGQPSGKPVPPELHWAMMNGGIGREPPPTLMMNSSTRVKETQVDIRELSTPSQPWVIGPNVTFPDDTDHNLVGSATPSSSTSPPSHPPMPPVPAAPA
ncbi:unnamed protein product [Discosporangium mesarthrocarpum]